ncbi:MAG: DUF932 domain-containing protein [Bacteroidia bacterium]
MPPWGRSLNMTALNSMIVDTVRSAFDFTVDPFPLSGPDGMRTPYYGLFRSDNFQVVGRVVTKSYIPHQGDDIIALVEAASEAFEGVGNVRCYFKDGHYVSIQPTNEERRSIYGTEDNVVPRIVVRAGYDGKAFKASMGYYRDLCKNLAIMKMVSGTTVKIRHSSGLRSKMDQLIRTFSVLKNSWASLADVIGHLEQRTVNISDFLTEIYGEPGTGKSLTRHRNRTQSILERIYDERFRSGRPRIVNQEVSAWEAYNGVQGYVQWDATRKGSARLGEYGRAVAAFNDPAVAKAEELVMAMV